MKIPRHLAALALPLLLLGCTKAKTSSPEATSPPAFQELRDGWINDLQDRNLDAALSRYDKDAIYIGTDGVRVHGDNIRPLFQHVFATFSAHIAMQFHEAETSGDLAYEAGSYLETLNAFDTNAKTHLAGDYLTVYHRTSEGKWLIIEQVWTTAPPGTRATIK